jgi:hypothetical protein
MSLPVPHLLSRFRRAYWWFAVSASRAAWTEAPTDVGKTVRRAASGAGSGRNLPETAPVTRLFAAPDAEVVE